MLSALPIPLLLLLFAFPVLSTHSSTNDPFRVISLHTRKEPVCCLKPLPSVDPQPSEDALLLSFEDWKAKLLAEERGSANDNESTGWGSGKESVDVSNGRNSSSDSSIVMGSLAIPSVGTASFSQEQFDAGEQLSPHFRVPLTDRFNYASLDCSARVHTSHRSAKSTASILSLTKDRYMLSPCSTKSSDGKEENHFVVVELCDDIRIDTVQLANFEFFSGVFKDLTVSVAKTYTTEPEGWINAGTYRAKNVRGVQSFHPPIALRDFYRYIRIDFHSHYGNEYYCPVSLLRVFGLTHLEEWKWDIWEAESRAKRSGVLPISIDQSTNMPDGNSVASVSDSFSAEVLDVNVQDSDSLSYISTSKADAGDSRERYNNMRTSKDAADQSSTSHKPSMTDGDQHVIDFHARSDPTEGNVLANLGDRDTTTAIPFPSTTSHPGPSVTSSTTILSDTSYSITTEHFPPSHGSETQLPQLSADHTSSLTSDTSAISISRVSSPSFSPSTTPTISTFSQPSVNAPHAPSSGGESIYRTIMNRLTVLESNTTLYTRYVEEQTAGVREVLRRLGEDVGRLEGISKAQAQMYQRSLVELERYKRRVELEHGELMSRVNYLAEEVIMEKRLGIVQLCILVAVLVFMILTRGSRSELGDHGPAIFQRFSHDNSWGQRTLSFSGDWVSRFKSDGSTRKNVEINSQLQSDDQVEFPTYKTSETQIPNSRAGHPMSHMTASTSIRRTTAHPRTPQSRPAGRHVNKQSTPSGTHAIVPQMLLRPALPRTGSHGHTDSNGSSAVVGIIPRSAKKWARSAHLHEVKSDKGVHGAVWRSRHCDDGRSLSLTAASDITNLIVNEGKGRESSLRPLSSPTWSSSAENEIDVWVDTDDASSDLSLSPQ